jgi:hypothetical protein
MEINSVLIDGDRNLFLSKAAVDRFKKDMKTIKPDMVDVKKYLKDGYTFTFDKNAPPSTVHAKIITVAEEAELNRADILAEKRNNLKNRLRNAKVARSQAPRQKLASLKRSVPEKLFNAYFNIISKYQLPGIPAPDEVINNVDKYRTQIATIMGTIGNVSDNTVVNNDIKYYFNTLGEYLSIEPMNISQQQVQEPFISSVPPILNSDTEDEDEEPQLVASQ